jgi:hypothetical protein
LEEVHPTHTGIFSLFFPWILIFPHLSSFPLSFLFIQLPNKKIKSLNTSTMSKVSLKNELLPSFEPIKQKGTSQKRKRAAAASPALKDASANGADSQPAKKRSKGNIEK